MKNCILRTLLQHLEGNSRIFQHLQVVSKVVTRHIVILMVGNKSELDVVYCSSDSREVIFQ